MKLTVKIKSECEHALRDTVAKRERERVCVFMCIKPKLCSQIELLTKEEVDKVSYTISHEGLLTS